MATSTKSDHLKNNRLRSIFNSFIQVANLLIHYVCFTFLTIKLCHLSFV